MHHPAQSDYPAIVIDNDIMDMFICTYSLLQQGSVCCHTVHNKQACTKYATEAVKQITHHKILTNAKLLYNWVHKFSDEDRLILFRLHTHLTEILLSSEHKNEVI